MNAARAFLGLLRGAYAAWVLERRTLLAAALAYFGFLRLAYQRAPFGNIDRDPGGGRQRGEAEYSRALFARIG